ncbi:YhcH/YjgK/YiaL family protein [Gordoniibacillus kamchatkensis]|uniref:YhcH/YjgK/YiaL family protein n=1 Tax=Gordoniibacillus kamchatkensis TaxID=1590651 RepID=UPI000697A64A|nr:YhcH/YjgK/YiaL family protein [Paenibacillus sp. VKM B-2647]
MIWDKIANLGRYSFEHPGLAAAVQDMVSNLHGEAAEAARFVKNKMKFDTVAKAEKRFEGHRKYADIHVVLEGKEYVEVSHTDYLSGRTDYDEANDIYFGDVTSDLKFSGYLDSGSFLICFPEDTHLVGAHVDTEVEVTKMVYKVAL